MTVVFTISDNLKPLLLEFYKDKMVPNNPPYSVFQAKDYDCVTTLYNSGKLMFQGIGADIEASYWIEQERILNGRIIDPNQKKEKKTDSSAKTFFNENTIGSDEVGTGDFFGPIVVSATYVAQENIPFLIELGVKDSKKITDEKILKIAPLIIKKIPYTTYILNNQSFNEHWSENTNMNKIKAILHNKVLVSMQNKGYPYTKIVVDQFVYPKKYFEHIKEAKEKVTNITFVTKAEDKCLAVACASIISRYVFIGEMRKISASMGIDIPKGAGPKVDEVGRAIVKKYGWEKLSEIAKMNFKNAEKIKDGLA